MGRLEEEAVGHELRTPCASRTYDGKTRATERGRLKCVAVKCFAAAGGPHLDANIIH